MSVTKTKAPTELGTKKISSLLKSYAVPSIIAQTAASLYNMVDSIFIGHIPGVGATAISGLAVTFPLMNLSVALGTLVGIGANTLISIFLGQKNYDSAQKALSNVFSLNVIVGLSFAAVCLYFLDPILIFFGASEQTLPFAREYMQIILIGNVVTHLYHGFNGAIRSAGHPRLAMRLTLFTVISNSILDPIFIFGLDMGIKGAAIATVICQVLALSYSFRFLADKKQFLHFSKPLFQVDWELTKKTLAIGCGPCLMNAAACLVSILINQQLKKYGGDMSIGAYGLVNRFTMLFVLICIGLNQGLLPIAGYNYGARLYSRVKEIFILTAKWACAITALCFLMSIFMPRLAMEIFTEDLAMIELSAKGLRIMNLGFAFVGFSIIASNLFQSIGMVKVSIFLSLSRQLLFLLPLLYLFPLSLGELGVWITFPITDVISIIIAYLFIHRLFKKFNKLHDGDAPTILGSSIKG